MERASCVFVRSRLGTAMTDVTRILNAIGQGDPRAADELLPLVYEELRLLAAQKLSHESPGQTLQATALVHEAYIRLVGNEAGGWENRRHFFLAASEAMRRILIDTARRKTRLKRGGSQQRVDLDEGVLSLEASVPLDELLALDEALERLVARDATKAELVKLRFFGGLTHEQAARVLGISSTAADEHWAYARAWLRLEIGGDADTGSG